MLVPNAEKVTKTNKETYLASTPRNFVFLVKFLIHCNAYFSGARNLNFPTGGFPYGIPRKL